MNGTPVPVEIAASQNGTMGSEGFGWVYAAFIPLLAFTWLRKEAGKWSYLITGILVWFLLFSIGGGENVSGAAQVFGALFLTLCILFIPWLVFDSPWGKQQTEHEEQFKAQRVAQQEAVNIQRQSDMARWDRIQHAQTLRAEGKNWL